MLIGILGKKRHGKDTISNYLIKNFDYIPLTLAKPLKECCKILFGFNDDQLYGDKKEIVDEYWKITPRQAYQFIGTDLFRKQMSTLIPNIGNNLWVEIIKKNIIDIQKNNINANIVVTDLRFQNEVDMIKNLNGIVIKVNRHTVTPLDEHESEKGIDLIINYDYLVENNSTIEQLYKKIDEVLYSYMLDI